MEGVEKVTVPGYYEYVVVIVTSKDILMYIIIVYFHTPKEDAFPPFGMSLLCMVIEVNPPL